MDSEASNPSICTICYEDKATDKTYVHVVKNLHKELILEEYKSLSDAWKMYQAIILFEKYLGKSSAPQNAEIAQPCMLCLTKIINLVEASYILTQTSKNGSEQKSANSSIESETKKDIENSSRKPLSPSPSRESTKEKKPTTAEGTESKKMQQCSKGSEKESPLPADVLNKMNKVVEDVARGKSGSPERVRIEEWESMGSNTNAEENRAQSRIQSNSSRKRKPKPLKENGEKKIRPDLACRKAKDSKKNDSTPKKKVVEKALKGTTSAAKDKEKNPSAPKIRKSPADKTTKSEKEAKDLTNKADKNTIKTSEGEKTKERAKCSGKESKKDSSIDDENGETAEDPKKKGNKNSMERKRAAKNMDGPFTSKAKGLRATSPKNIVDFDEELSNIDDF